MSDYTPEQLAERTHDHLNKYIALADQKASLLLTAQFAFLGFSATIIRDNISSTTEAFQIISLVGAAVSLVGAVLAGLVIYPRTPKAETGFIFWQHITEFGSRTRFQDKFNELSSKESLDVVTGQNYSLAEVASDKYHYLRWSLNATAVMVALASIAVGIYLS